MEMRIDDLAKRAGVPTRTIRYYTQQGLLPSPNLRGRVGFYDDGHLDRLRLIKELQEKRYLPLSVIKSVLRFSEEGADLETMLTPLDILYQPRWDADGTAQFKRTELAKAANVETDIVDAAEEMGFLFPQGEGRDRRYSVDDVHILGIVERWLELGLPRNLGRLYRASLEEISQQQVRAFNHAVVLPLISEHPSPDEARQRLLDGFDSMQRVFNELVAVLHRKVLQKVVETEAADQLAAQR